MPSRCRHVAESLVASRPQVPLEIELGDLGIEPVLLGALDGAIDLQEARPNILF